MVYGYEVLIFLVPTTENNFIILFLRVMLVFLRVMEIDPYFIIFKIYTHLLNKNSSYFEIMIMFLIITKCVKKIVF